MCLEKERDSKSVVSDSDADPTGFISTSSRVLGEMEKKKVCSRPFTQVYVEQSSIVFTRVSVNFCF